MLTNDNWTEFSKTIAMDADPSLHSPAAMDRAMHVFKDYIVRVPTPTGKFKARNNCRLIFFKNDVERKFYDAAWQRYLEACERAKKDAADGRLMQLVAMMQFRKAADIIRADSMADLLAQGVKDGFAPIGVTCFRQPIAKMVRRLVREHGYSRDDISLIWGGDDSLSASKRLSQQQIMDIVMQISLGKMAEIPKKTIRQFEAQLAESDEDKRIIEETKDINLDLGNQDRKARQREIDKFQTGKSKICLFTFSAGGVGLSLHHTDRDERGNPVSLRPRRTYLAPTYSAQDFVQGLGRAHRSIFSLSDTEQTIIFYAGTIEEHVMEKVSIKLRCLSKVVRQRESWMDAISNAVGADNIHDAVVGDDALRKDFDNDAEVGESTIETEQTGDEDDE